MRGIAARTRINARSRERSGAAVWRAQHAHEHNVPDLQPAFVQPAVGTLRVVENFGAVAGGPCEQGGVGTGRRR